MGCATALRVAEGGMKAIVLEKGDLCAGASSANAGTLSLQIKRVKLMPYALKGHECWEEMGDAVGFRKTGGYTLAFTQREEELLIERQTMKREAGAPIHFLSTNEVLEAEPNLSDRIRAASFCAEDGYANSLLTGRYYRARLRSVGVPYREHCEVFACDRDNGVFSLRTTQGKLGAKRLLFACGGWLKQGTAMLGVDLPVRARVNTVSVTERSPRLLGSVIGHATGLLTMKQKENGTILIGGGWQGSGTPENTARGHVDADTVVPNIALAQFAVSRLSELRIARCWTGFEANVPDFYPLAGALPVENTFVLGCVRGGYTIGPFISELMGDLILGKEPAMPLFDPNREYMMN